jgi:general stress protein YciG
MFAIDPKLPKPSETPIAPKADGPPADEVPALEVLLACGETEATAEPVVAPARAPRGFAAMDPALVREIARRGARASHEKGTAHKFTADEARAAGRKGGSAPHRVRGRGKRPAVRQGA